MSIMQAMVEVLDRLSRREGGTMPSADVQRKALRLLRAPKSDGKIVRHVERAVVYDVQGGEPWPYSVELFIQGTAKVPDHIVRARCSCPAGRAETTCAHLISALTCAERDGLHLSI